MYTSLLLTTLAGLAAERLPAAEVAWSADYQAARQMVRSERKPLAVFLGSGENGYEKVCRDGTLSKAAQQALQKHYVSVYVDMSTPSGKQLARDFGITKSAGLVISDRGGATQAFHHNGPLKKADLTRTLTRYADPKLVVRRTETVPAPAAQPRAAQPVQNAAAPAMNYAPPQFGGFQPSFGMGMGMGMGMGGGCRT